VASDGGGSAADSEEDDSGAALAAAVIVPAPADPPYSSEAPKRTGLRGGIASMLRSLSGRASSAKSAEAPPSSLQMAITNGLSPAEAKMQAQQSRSVPSCALHAISTVLRSISNVVRAKPEMRSAPLATASPLQRSPLQGAEAAQRAHGTPAQIAAASRKASRKLQVEMRDTSANALDTLADMLHPAGSSGRTRGLLMQADSASSRSSGSLRSGSRRRGAGIMMQHGGDDSHCDAPRQSSIASSASGGRKRGLAVMTVQSSDARDALAPSASQSASGGRRRGVSVVSMHSGDAEASAASPAVHLAGDGCRRKIEVQAVQSGDAEDSSASPAIRAASGAGRRWGFMVGVQRSLDEPGHTSSADLQRGGSRASGISSGGRRRGASIVMQSYSEASDGAPTGAAGRALSIGSSAVPRRGSLQLVREGSGATAGGPRRGRAGIVVQQDMSAAREGGIGSARSGGHRHGHAVEMQPSTDSVRLADGEGASSDDADASGAKSSGSGLWGFASRLVSVPSSSASRKASSVLSSIGQLLGQGSTAGAADTVAASKLQGPRASRTVTASAPQRDMQCVRDGRAHARRKILVVQSSSEQAAKQDMAHVQWLKRPMSAPPAGHVAAAPEGDAPSRQRSRYRSAGSASAARRAPPLALKRGMGGSRRNVGIVMQSGDGASGDEGSGAQGPRPRGRASRGPASGMRMQRGGV
jgi:hypothetical protein